MFYMMKKYDLTTEAGRSFMEILFPGPSLVYKIGKLFLPVTLKVLGHRKKWLKP